MTRAERLFASDDPEHVLAPSVLLEVTLPAGCSRLFYDHVNGSDADMVLAVVLINDSSLDISFSYRAGHGGPGGDGMAVGHLACAAFLQATVDKESVIQSRSRRAFIARLFSPGTNLCGVFEIDAKAPLRAIVAAMPPAVAPEDAVGTLRPAKSDGYNRSGIFPLLNHEDSLEVPEGAVAIIGDLSIKSTENRPLKGDYGIIRTFDFALPKTAQDQSFTLMFEPCGGAATGTFLIQGRTYEVARSAAHVPIRILEIPSNTASLLSVTTMAELNSFYPVKLSIVGNTQDRVSATSVRTIAGAPSSSGLTALANVSRAPRPLSRVMEPLASRLLNEPSSLLAHKYNVILQIDMSRQQNLGLIQGILDDLFSRAGVASAPVVSASHGYISTQLTVDEITAILLEDAGANPLIKSIWEDHAIHPLLIDSLPLVKGDAAHASFGALGEGIVWTVIDSGIEKHAHFTVNSNLEAPPGLSHLDFTSGSRQEVSFSDLSDPYGHGTHVAGIIAGAWTSDPNPSQSTSERPDPAAPAVDKTTTMRSKPSGVAPRAKLLSFRVIDENGGGSASAMVAALDEVFRINGYGSAKRIHGVNISVGYNFNPTWDACGRTPVCEAVNRLVDSGVIVVVAAGNSGDMLAPPIASAARTVGLLASINDPGNADRAITVASCYNREPFVDGIAASSSKGPTADGRLKPDIAAPGERIVSCAAGSFSRLHGGVDYIELSGTSMAAPHVSGALAAFLSVRREFIGRPTDIRARMMRHATDLARDRAFQGAGLINLFAMLAE